MRASAHQSCDAAKTASCQAHRLELALPYTVAEFNPLATQSNGVIPREVLSLRMRGSFWCSRTCPHFMRPETWTTSVVTQMHRTAQLMRRRPPRGTNWCDIASLCGCSNSICAGLSLRRPSWLLPDVTAQFSRSPEPLALALMEAEHRALQPLCRKMAEDRRREAIAPTVAVTMRRVERSTKGALLRRVFAVIALRPPTAC